MYIDESNQIVNKLVMVGNGEEKVYQKTNHVILYYFLFLVLWGLRDFSV